MSGCFERLGNVRRRKVPPGALESRIETPRRHAHVDTRECAPGTIPFVVDQHSVSVLLGEGVLPYRRQPPIPREHVALTEENEIARRGVFDELVLAKPIDCAQSLERFDGAVEVRVEQPRNVDSHPLGRDRATAAAGAETRSRTDSNAATRSCQETAAPAPVGRGGGVFKTARTRAGNSSRSTTLSTSACIRKPAMGVATVGVSIAKHSYALIGSSESVNGVTRCGTMITSAC